MNKVGSIASHNSLQTVSIKLYGNEKLLRAFWSYTPPKVKNMCICKRDVKMKNTTVQNKSKMSGVHCSTRSFEYIMEL